jgi:hypothetical protein
MKAEFQEFNGNWFKLCPKCGSNYGANSIVGLLEFFRKDRTKIDGIDCVCKICKKSYRKNNKNKELNRWKNYYAPGTEARKRHNVRSQTRRKYGSAKNHKCHICELAANEWHHIEYKIDSVIPLCSSCHETI